jgi:hypothetical protein
MSRAYDNDTMYTTANNSPKMGFGRDMAANVRRGPKASVWFSRREIPVHATEVGSDSYFKYPFTRRPPLRTLDAIATVQPPQLTAAFHTSFWLHFMARVFENGSLVIHVSARGRLLLAAEVKRDHGCHITESRDLPQFVACRLPSWYPVAPQLLVTFRVNKSLGDKVSDFHCSALENSSGGV